MNLIDTLLLLLAVQFTLFGLAWAAGALLLGLPRLAALHWTAFSLLAALSTALFLAEDWIAALIAQPARNLALLMAVMLLRRGVSLFMKRASQDTEQMAILTVVVVGLVLTHWLPQPQWVRVALVSSAVGWVLIRSGFEQIKSVGHEFGVVSGRLLGLPPVLLGSVFMARAVAALMADPDAALLRVRQGMDVSAVLLVTLLLISTLLEFSLLYIVILRMVRKLQRLSSMDELTQLLNRRSWQRALLAERLRLRRHPRPTAVLAIDLDHFKDINDRHGHIQGDLVLREVARCLESSARATDIVARLGGEEFGLLLPDTDQAGALEAAERLRQAVAALNLRARLERLNVTISVGVAVLPASAEHLPADVFDDLQADADAALYAAKAAGRNQVMLAPARWPSTPA